MTRRQSRRGVLVVAAEPLLARGIAAALEPPFAVLATVGTVHAAQRAVAALRPHLLVVVLDPPLPDASRQEACDRLIGDHPGTAALALLHHPDGPLVRIACHHGTRGVLPTSVGPEELRDALVRLDAGQEIVHPSLLRFLMEPAIDEEATQAGAAALTGRELTALRLLAAGYSSKDIAPVLRATPRAVDLLIERAARRLGARHRTHAVVLAIQLGLVPLETSTSLPSTHTAA